MCDPCCLPCGFSRPCGPCSPCDPCCAPFEPKACRSRELRCGIMYTNCDCIKRNGLQDKCPRSLCQGRSACMSLPNPGCCPASFPLRYANITMGVRKRRCGSSCYPASAPPPYSSCGPSDMTTPCCGPSNPACGAPSPIPWSPSPNCCPPLPEGGIPDPRIWNGSNTPACYPCHPRVCPTRYLKRSRGPCKWPYTCRAHCYKTCPKRCC